MDQVNTQKWRVIVLGSLCAAVLFNGCARHTPLAITNRYLFPVTVYDMTNPNYPPTLLGVVAPGATLNSSLVGNSDSYRLAVRRVPGKIIKQLTISRQTASDKGVLVIGG